MGISDFIAAKKAQFFEVKDNKYYEDREKRLRMERESLEYSQSLKDKAREEEKKIREVKMAPLREKRDRILSGVSQFKATTKKANNFFHSSEQSSKTLGVQGEKKFGITPTGIFAAPKDASEKKHHQQIVIRIEK